MKKTEKARALRRDGTEAERRLWRALRNWQISGAKFRRQLPVGHYIADFACLERKLIVELDGGQHSEAKSYDERRTAELAGLGFRVIRFWNNDVLQNLEGVVAAIEVGLEDENQTPHPDPLP